MRTATSAATAAALAVVVAGLSWAATTTTTTASVPVALLLAASFAAAPTCAAAAFSVPPPREESGIFQQQEQRRRRRRQRPRAAAFTTTANKAAANDHDGNAMNVVNVVLFGPGDLRLDDHLGFANAVANNKGGILPLCILNDSMLQSLPGAVAHTVDTAKLLAEALSDLDASLRKEFGGKDEGPALHMQLSPSAISLKESLIAIKKQLPVDVRRLRVHVCDLGDADNQMGYGSFSQLMSDVIDDDNDDIEIVTWSNNLRPTPWRSVETLPEDFPSYERAYATTNVPPLEPVSVDNGSMRIDSDSFISLERLQSIPSEDLLVEKFVSVLNLDMERCIDERNTGLYGTHYGGLDPASVGGTAVLKTLNAYVVGCEEDDKRWFVHPMYIDRRCKRNGRSLEHAAMAWQLRGTGMSPVGNAENWMAGESMVRYLTIPLLLGTVSPRRVWHMSRLDAIFFPSPLKRLVEGREWHRLLAARNIRTDLGYQTTEAGSNTPGETKYGYWRYHGFLCRYAQTDFPGRSTVSGKKDGIVLVHGFGASGSQFNKAIQEMSTCVDPNVCQQGFAPDLIGFGQSEKPAVSYTGYMWDAMVMDFCKEEIIPKHDWKSFVVGGNSIGGFTSMSLAASDTAAIGSREVSSSGAPGTGLCSGLVLMNSAGPVKTRDEIDAERTGAKKLQLESVAQVTALNALPACKPPPRPVGRAFGNVLLSYLRPRIQSICKNLYPTNPDAVNLELCNSIERDSLDPGAINVMMAGAKLPVPRTANELLNSDFGAAPTASSVSSDLIPESTFTGPVLIAQGVLDPLNDATDRMNRFGALRDGITTDPLQAGHCPHDELPAEMARSISAWMLNTRSQRQAITKSSPAASAFVR